MSCIFIQFLNFFPFVLLEEPGESRSSHGGNHQKGFQHQGHSSHRPLNAWREIQGQGVLPLSFCLISGTQWSAVGMSVALGS